MKTQLQISAKKINAFPVAGFRWLTLGFVIFLALVFVWADRGSLPKAIVWLYAFPEGDKAGHFGLYGLLSFLLALSFPAWQVRAGRLVLPASLLVVLMVALGEEFSQAFFSTRSASLLDIAAGWLGALVMGYAAWRLIDRWSSKGGLQ
jgi:polysaccharide biosynthesis protein VpsQ